MVDRFSNGSDPEFDHAPVMADEVVALVATCPDGPYLDATLGGAGHASAVLAAAPQLSLIGLDRDPAALAASSIRLASFEGRVELHRIGFDRLAEVIPDGVGLSAFLFDLGVSSPQLDVAARGFSYRHDGPLDMRMDPDGPTTAADIVNGADRSELARLLREGGDERFADRIAKAIVARRPITSTTELAEVIVGAIPAPARRTGGHPAKRSFQALRIAVNGELQVLAPALNDALDHLVPGGRGLVLTYHSGEDRIVKDVYRQRTTSDVPVGLPVEDEPEFRLLRPLATKATPAEAEANPRARSARLRGIERVAA